MRKNRSRMPHQVSSCSQHPLVLPLPHRPLVHLPLPPATRKDKADAHLPQSHLLPLQKAQKERRKQRTTHLPWMVIMATRALNPTALAKLTHLAAPAAVAAVAAAAVVVVVQAAVVAQNEAVKHCQ